MRIAVEFQGQSLDFEVADDRLVAHWSGPSAGEAIEAGVLARKQFEAPLDFPPLCRAVVKGDRVVVPYDPITPLGFSILETLVKVLQAAQVASITVVSTAPKPPDLTVGVAWLVHDPEDKSQIAYLASTAGGRRIYLNRQLTEADIVIPIGSLGYDATLGYRGPWSTIFPGLSDLETQTRLRGLAIDGAPDADRPSVSLLESSEVSWLLGCQFQVGVLGGSRGIGRVIAGLELSVRENGMKSVDDTWTFRVSERADVVVAGLGEACLPAGIDELAACLATATRLVRRGGKVVALSSVAGEPGPSLQRIRGAENPRSALIRLRGHDADSDFLAARRIAEATAWADVYVHGSLDPDLVEDLSMIPVERPEEARKIALAAPSCILLSHSDRTRAIVADEV